MSITTVKRALTAHFENMQRDAQHLFEMDVDKDALWRTYLEIFDDKYNKIYRVRREHDCSACRQFIKNIGAVVSIKDGRVTSIWDMELDRSNEYAAPFAVLSELVKSRPIKDVYLSKFAKVGIDKNHESTEAGIITYEHFFVNLPNKFVVTSGESIDTRKSELRSAKDVFGRALEELSEDSIQTVLELINSNTLYKGQEWQGALNQLLEYKLAYLKLTGDSAKQCFQWEASLKVGPAISRIKNHSIGVLLTDISGGMDLDTAVRRYEKIVAPENYKRPKPIFTQKMLDDAKQTVIDLGYSASLRRRFARLDDININNILFANRDASKRISKGDVFADMSNSLGVDTKKFSKIDEVSIDTFITEILPTASEVEVLLENKHAASAVSLITAADASAPSMFKWDNNFSWAYKGNITDSSMKENVKSAGGNVDGVMRFSIQWNDGSQYNRNDMDAHCVEPSKYRIYFGNRNSFSPTGGKLDVDIISPVEGVPAVENITWATSDYLREGAYEFYVHCYNNRGGTDGFNAEIEVDGVIHAFAYNNHVRQDESVHVATVTYGKANGFTVNERLPATTSSREIWGLKTGNFVPVSVIMKSPNFWDGQAGIGHEHVFFMLKDCINDENPNGFYNEFLKHDLEKYKHVFEALGSKMKVDAVDDQLSGIGFSTTKRAELVVKVKGYAERMFRVRF